MAKSKADEQDIAASSFILNFYQEVQQLKIVYAQYENLMLELEKTYPGANFEKSTEEDMGKIKYAAQQVRQAIILAHVSYVSIASTVNKFKVNAKLENTFKKIKSTFIISREDLYEYVTLINTILLNEVIENLLLNSQQIVEGLYTQNGDTEQ